MLPPLVPLDLRLARGPRVRHGHVVGPRARVPYGRVLGRIFLARVRVGGRGGRPAGLRGYEGGGVEGCAVAVEWAGWRVGWVGLQDLWRLDVLVLLALEGVLAGLTQAPLEAVLSLRASSVLLSDRRMRAVPAHHDGSFELLDIVAPPTRVYQRVQ